MDKRLIAISTLALITTATWALAPQNKPAAPAAPAKPAVAAQDTKPKAAAKEEAEEDEEEVIKLADAPDAVRNAVAKLTPADKVTKVTKEEDDGIVVFEVEYTQDGLECSADLSKAGDILALEKGVKEAAMPAAVMAALKKEFPKATFKSFNSVQKFSYEVEVVIDGKKHEVEIDAAGNMEDGEDGEADEKAKEHH